jgi:hypothetical protein
MPLFEVTLSTLDHTSAVKAVVITVEAEHDEDAYSKVWAIVDKVPELKWFATDLIEGV